MFLDPTGWKELERGKGRRSIRLSGSRMCRKREGAKDELTYIDSFE